MAAESVKWVLQCLRFGERLERDGRSVHSMVVGLRLQKEMHSISGDHEEEALLEERLGLTGAAFRGGLSKDSEVLLSRDERVLADYISESAAHGELRALQFLNNEVERLKNLPGYDPCVP